MHTQKFRKDLALFVLASSRLAMLFLVGEKKKKRDLEIRTSLHWKYKALREGRNTHREGSSLALLYVLLLLLLLDGLGVFVEGDACVINKPVSSEPVTQYIALRQCGVHPGSSSPEERASAWAAPWAWAWAAVAVCPQTYRRPPATLTALLGATCRHWAPCKPGAGSGDETESCLPLISGPWSRCVLAPRAPPNTKILCLPSCARLAAGPSHMQRVPSYPPTTSVH